MENDIITLTGSANVEIDVKKSKVYISEFGEHICSLSFDEVRQIEKQIKASTISVIMAFFKRVTNG